MEPQPHARKIAELESAATTPVTPSRILDVEKLDFFYGRNQALFGVDLPVERNRITALIGPSGCGKSTLLRSLNRIYELYADQRAVGRILLNGDDILRPNTNLASLRARVGMVFQKPTPFPDVDLRQHRLRGAALHQQAAP